MTRNYRDMLAARRASGTKLLCVGLDPDVESIANHQLASRRELATLQYRLCCEVIDATVHLAVALKPQFGFFAETGAYDELTEVIKYAKLVAPDVPVILDFKRGDIGKTNRGYRGEAFDIYEADAVTLHSFLGHRAMEPLLADPDKFAYLLCRTSNPESDEFQGRWTRLESDDERAALGTEDEPDHAKHFEVIAYNLSRKWNKNGNVGVVAGATYPGDLYRVREIIGPDMEMLIPGIGTQGGDVEAAVSAGGEHCVINSSSGIMFPKEGSIGEAAEATYTSLAAAA